MKYLKTLVFAIALTVALVASVMGFAKLPGKVIEVEAKVTSNTAAIDQLAHTVDKYIGEQMVYKESQEKREELMIKLIEKMAR